MYVESSPGLNLHNTDKQFQCTLVLIKLFGLMYLPPDLNLHNIDQQLQWTRVSFKLFGLMYLPLI